MMHNESLLSTRLEIDDTGYRHLFETSKWAKFLAVVGMILSLLLGLIGVFAGSFMRMFMATPENMPLMSAAMVAIFYMLIAALYFFTSLFLYRFAVNMQSALQHNDQETFNTSLANHRRFYKIIGMIMVFYLVIMALAVVFMVFVFASTGL